MNSTNENSTYDQADFPEPEGIVEFDTEGILTFFNEAAEKITGFSSAKVLAHKYDVLFRETENFAEKFQLIISDGKSPGKLALRIESAEGENIEIIASLFPQVTSGGKISGAALVFRDRRTRKALYDLLEEKTLELILERNKLESIFNSRIEGTFTIDKECRINLFNRSAERITGYSSSEALGKKCWELLGSDFCSHECGAGRNKKVIMQNDEANVKEIFITRKDGSRLPIRLTVAPLFDFEGEIMGVVDTFQDISELKNLSNHIDDRFQLNKIIGRSQCMDKVYRLIANVSKSDSTILITGESGTGKELVARAIHLNSLRRSGPFIPLNCSAFAETLLESELFGHEKGAFTGAVYSKQGRFGLAQGGTLFLDEIGDVSPTVQVKLLRVLETRQFEKVGGTKSIEMDVRLIVATNKNLMEKLDSEQIREDFYYRINVINIHLPPLRARIDDLPLLLQNLLKVNSEKFRKNIVSISPRAMDALTKYQWPGNIRELENVMEHAFVMCRDEVIKYEHLPEKVFSGIEQDHLRQDLNSSVKPIENAEKRTILKALKKFDNHRGKTAAMLGIDKTTLWRKMKKYDLL